MFEELLFAFVLFLGIVVITGFINEKFIKLPNEIAYLLVGLLISAVMILALGGSEADATDLIMPHFFLEDFLVKGVLCFMMFAGAYRLRFCDIRPRIKLISFLAIFTTIVAAAIYGGLCYLATTLLGLPFTFAHCLLLGAIISPTDPIAAMSILRKVGLPHDTGLVIEGESLFNDGVGIALFTVIAGIVEGGGEFSFVSFSTVLLESLLGAVAVGFVVSFVLFFIFKHTKNKHTQIFTSLLAVSGSYVLCETFGFSAAIAAVVCGIFFATVVDRFEQKDPAPYEEYRNFWSVVDSLLNAVLYVMLGLTFVNVFLYAPQNAVFILICLVCNIVARWLGVFGSALVIKEKPQGYGAVRFTNLFTWAGLKGALCLALAMSTNTFLEPDIFNSILAATFAIVLFTTLGQGLTIGRFYKSGEKRAAKKANR